MRTHATRRREPSRISRAPADPSSPAASSRPEVRQLLHGSRLARQEAGSTISAEAQQLCFGVPTTGAARCEFTSAQNRRVVATLYAARSLAGRALLNLGAHDPYLRTLAARIFDVVDPNISALIATTQQIRAALNLPVHCGSCADSICNPEAAGLHGAHPAAYVPDDLGSIVVCPFFFALDVGQMRRTFLHEAGHAAGIDAGSVDASGQYRHPQNCDETSAGCVDPCSGVQNRLQNVDVWARFLECAAYAR